MGTWPAILDSHWDLQDLHTFLGSKWSLDGHCAPPKATLDGFAHPTTHHFGPWASEWYQPQKEHQPRPTHTVSHPQQGNFVRTRRVSITQKGVDDAPVRFFSPKNRFGEGKTTGCPHRFPPPKRASPRNPREKDEAHRQGQPHRHPQTRAPNHHKPPKGEGEPRSQAKPKAPRRPPHQ